MLHHSPADRPVRLGLERAVGVDRAWTLVVEKHRPWAHEYAVFEVEPVIHEDPVLELAAIADANLEVDVHALAEDAVPADPGSLSDLRLVPDPCAGAELRVVGDVGARVDVHPFAGSHRARNARARAQLCAAGCVRDPGLPKKSRITVGPATSHLK